MRPNYLFPILIGVLGFSLVLLLLNHDSGFVFGMPNHSFAQLVALASIGLFIAGGFLASGRGLGRLVRTLAVWALIILALVAVYLYRYDLQQFGAELTAGLIPGLPVTRTGVDGTAEVMLYKTRSGHFETSAWVDGHRLRFLIDTGASRVVLSYRDAEAIGIDMASLAFNQTVQTANGQASAASVMLDGITLGPIRRDNIEASVSARGMLDESLLGMNFLETLTSFRMSRDTLVLQN